MDHGPLRYFYYTSPHYTHSYKYFLDQNPLQDSLGGWPHEENTKIITNLQDKVIFMLPWSSLLGFERQTQGYYHFSPSKHLKSSSKLQENFLIFSFFQFSSFMMFIQDSYAYVSLYHSIYTYIHFLQITSPRILT